MAKLALFWCLNCWLGTDFTHCSSAFLVDFEHVNVSFLNFNFFGNALRRKQTIFLAMLCTENKPEADFTLLIIYYASFCDNVMSGSLCAWENSSNLDDGGIVDLPLYAIIFGLHDKIGSIEEDKDPEDSSIHILVSSLFISVREIWFIASCVEKLLFSDRSICIPAFLQSFIWIKSLILEIFK